ncbi:MAG: hypothetical protein ACJ8G3_22645 [Burkholderiaceae bacterium]
MNALEHSFSIGKEFAMYQSDKPDREQVRQWLRHEIALRRPPPDPREIRRQLGWHQANWNKANGSHGRG